MANTDNQLQDFFGVMNSAQKVMFGLLLSLVIIISGAIFFWALQARWLQFGKDYLR